MKRVYVYKNDGKEYIYENVYSVSFGAGSLVLSSSEYEDVWISFSDIYSFRVS